jgi:hypothetical protein
MTNDQFPIPNGGARTARYQTRHREPLLDWSLAIRNWSLPEIIREWVRE